MQTDIIDIVVHIDETLEHSRLATIEEGLRRLDGVVSVCNQENKPHLLVATFNLAKINAHDILAYVIAQGVHAELTGL